MEFSIAFVMLSDNTVRVDVAVACGHRFEGIAFIRDAFNFYPRTGDLHCTLELPKPLGFGAVNQILHEWPVKARQLRSLEN